ncbi:acid-sensing ion channel 1 isoform X2 [Brachionus plicatilis]|uniref:Acid-sensing ion channel 1 isoform X2 n=1 Tax=Brachionus plicatilis TaxID=10195 RepID=A0A3M7PY51_BRAPC|nr:acid-sensing ion channel 1 isoform X2 [Brachionus plicatilis]
MSEIYSDERKDKNKSSIFADFLKKKCANSTAHALSHAFSDEMIGIRIFWGFLFLAGISITICVIYLTISSYYKYDFSIKLSIQEKYFDDFPAVSFCNLNAFDKSDPLIIEYFNAILSRNNFSEKIKPTKESPAIYQVQQQIKLLYANLLDDLVKFRTSLNMEYSFEDLVISCYYNGQICGSQDFESFYNYDYSKCFTFNKKQNETTKVKKTSRTGPGSGLMLELFIGLAGIEDTFIEKRGIYLAVHNNSVNPVVNHEGMKLSVGNLAEIGIKRTFYQKLPEPYNKCRKDTSSYSDDDSEYYKRTVRSGVYSKKKCFEFCLQVEFIYPECNCNDPQITSLEWNQTFCKSNLELHCVDRVRNMFDSGDLSKLCSDNCPTSCDTLEYATEVSYSDYPSEYYYSIIKDQPNVIEKFENISNITFDKFKKSTLMVNVFYQDITSTFVQESPLINVEDLFSSIGGFLGLFLGCSVLTLFEPVVFLILVVAKLIENKKFKK